MLNLNPFRHELELCSEVLRKMLQDPKLPAEALADSQELRLNGCLLQAPVAQHDPLHIEMIPCTLWRTAESPAQTGSLRRTRSTIPV